MNDVDTSVVQHVCAQRLWDRHEDLARFGATAGGGVNRQALSPQEFAARRRLLEWGHQLDLIATGDAAGNLFLRLPGRNAGAAPVMTGSHLDSQPTGGKYDGTFGVLAGLEALTAMREAHHVPERPIDLVVWMNEEGSRFAPGMMGSEAFSGARPLADILQRRDAGGTTVAVALAELFAAFADLPQRPLGFPVAAFVEAHIEQGPQLEAAATSIGIVSGIAGKKTFRVTVTGEAAHAGTTPRRDRRDALRSAVAIIDRLYAAIRDSGDVVRFTVGRLVVEPNAPSVVPGRAQFSIDVRHPDGPQLEAFGDRIVALCREFAPPCAVAVEPLVNAAPLTFPPGMRDLIREAATRQGYASLDLASQAGHDARNLHTVCATGMIFIPCARGLSHHEAESASASDMAAGTAVLAATLVALAARER